MKLNLLLGAVLFVAGLYVVTKANEANQPKPKLAAAAPSAWSKAVATIDAVYGADVDDETTEEIVAAFVGNAGKSDKAAPLTGTREQKAAYYLTAYAKLVRSIHDEIYLREQAQQAAEAKVAELKARLPK